MLQVKPDTTIKEYQRFVYDIYGLANNRYFGVQDMMTNIERFMTRGLKGIRKGDSMKTRSNLMISFSWFMSMQNQLHIDIEEEVWKRFPYVCSYCASCPCGCKAQKVKTRRSIIIDDRKKPKMLEDYQKMFNEIYPASARTLDHAGVHLAEETGEVAESILIFRGNHEEEDFRGLILESADFVSCMMGVFNSLEMSLAKELSLLFNNNCHDCHKAPCVCNFIDITQFKS